MLRRRLGLILLGVVVGVVAALVFSYQQDKTYEASAALLFRPLLLDVQTTGLPLQLPSGDPQREAATNLALVSLDDVSIEAAARLPGYTPKRVKDDVDISQKGRSNLVWITGHGPTPEAAAQVANAVAGAYVAFRRAGLRHQVRVAASRVRAALRAKGLGPLRRRVLRANLSRLQLLASVQTGDAQFVQRAEPPSKPSSPKPVFNAVIGGALGLLIGLALALGAEQLDRRVRRPEQLEGALDMPLLTAVPRSKALRKGADWSHYALDGDVEPFRRLRANLRYFADDREIRSVLVTSAGAESGKTTVALHLAAAAAAATRGGVLLIEADLRRPRLAELLGLPADKGLSRVLQSADALDGEPLEDVFTVPVGHEGPNGAGRDGTTYGGRFDALAAGPPPPDASGLLDSDRMREILRAARARYDLVVIDGPPTGLVSDAIPLAKQADGVLVVGRLGRESESELNRLRWELERLGVRPLGAVANFSRRVPSPYYPKSK
jgi:tyrosine-protein kinase